MKYKKDYTKYLHVCGKSKHKQTQMVVDNWLPEFPELTVLYSPIDVPINEKEQKNIIYIRDRVSDEKLAELLIHAVCIFAVPIQKDLVIISRKQNQLKPQLSH